MLVGGVAVPVGVEVAVGGQQSWPVNGTATAGAWSSATATTSHHCCPVGRGAGPARERHAHRRDDRRAQAVLLSAPAPPWARKSSKLAEVLPLHYLHGLPSGDFAPALEQFLGSSAGLSPATVTRRTAHWQADHTAFQDGACSLRTMSLSHVVSLASFL